MGRLVGIAWRASSGAPMVEVESARITVQAGVEDDLRGKVGKRQVTVLSAEAWRRACQEIGRDLPWTTRRANLLVSGLDLRDSRDGHLRIGGLILKITGECDPCRRMREAHPGLEEALGPEWRGGVTARVRASGVARVGDDVTLEPPPQTD